RTDSRAKMVLPRWKGARKNLWQWERWPKSRMPNGGWSEPAHYLGRTLHRTPWLLADPLRRHAYSNESQVWRTSGRDATIHIRAKAGPRLPARCPRSIGSWKFVLLRPDHPSEDRDYVRKNLHRRPAIQGRPRTIADAFPQQSFRFPGLLQNRK